MKHIIFDIGQVLFIYNPEKIIDTLLPHTSHKQFYLDHLFKAQLWQDMDRGIISQEDARETLFKAVAYDQTQMTELTILFREWVHQLELIEDNKNLLVSLKKNYSIYFLSNFQDAPFDKIEKKYNFFQLANGKVISSKVKQMKPEKEIYHTLLNTYNLEAKDCLFIDDLPTNISSCKELGMNGIVFQNYTQLCDDLKSYNIHFN